jgi:hypothetical protein
MMLSPLYDEDMSSDVWGAIAAVVFSSLSALLSIETVRTFVSRAKPKGVNLVLGPVEIEWASDVVREELQQAELIAANAAGSTPAPPETPATPAEIEALAIIEIYREELLAEAGRIAKRANAERPSKAHVRQAADRIGILRDRAGSPPTWHLPSARSLSVARCPSKSTYGLAGRRKATSASGWRSPSLSASAS